MPWPHRAPQRTTRAAHAWARKVQAVIDSALSEERTTRTLDASAFRGQLVVRPLAGPGHLFIAYFEDFLLEADGSWRWLTLEGEHDSPAVLCMSARMNEKRLAQFAEIAKLAATAVRVQGIGE